MTNNYENSKGLFHIEDDLSDTWLEDWAKQGVAEIGAHLLKYAEFDIYLAENSIDTSAENLS